MFENPLSAENLSAQKSSAYFVSRMNAENALSMTMDIGKRLLCCGAEISRVEDSLRRICTAFGSETVDVTSITSVIVVTVSSPVFGTLTQSRRILETRYDLQRLQLLSNLSRRICSAKGDFSFVPAALAEIDNAPVYPPYLLMLTYALISGSFSLFFGGSFADSVVAAGIGLVLYWAEAFLLRLHTNAFLRSVLLSFVGGVLACGSVALQLAGHSDLISIGNIMLLIPGVALTNSLRDLLVGDLISGLLRFFGSLLLAITVAFGFVAAAGLF